MSKPTTGDFTKTSGWMDWYSGPAKPRFALPAGAVDARTGLVVSGEYANWTTHANNPARV